MIFEYVRQPHGFVRASLHVAEVREQLLVRSRAAGRHCLDTWRNELPRGARGSGRFSTAGSPADITLDTLRYDGVAVEEYFVDRPAFFPEIPPDFDATRARPTVRLKDDIRSPLTAAACGEL